jgi:hypothetical protein
MFKIYYTDPVTDWSHAKNADTVTESLQYSEGFRKLGMVFVTMVAEDPMQVGKSGVDAVVDGKTPDGMDYTWNKASRIGQTKRR